MSNTILPSGEAIQTTPAEILQYLNPDGIRQMLRQERLRWNLKPNREAEYYDNELLYKYLGELINNGSFARMEVRTFPDNGAPEGFAGVNIDSGCYGIPHNYDKWDHAMTDESRNYPVNRVMIGAQAKITDKKGTGMDDDNNMVDDTSNRMASMVFDPYDGRAYLLSNDPSNYINNANRKVEERIPDRAVARIGDVPTRIAQLINDKDYISDPGYIHTDNNFTNSNRYVVDNLDDRTFVYPEISRDKNGGQFVNNVRIGLDGNPGYNEADGTTNTNSQPDLGENPDLGEYGDRFGEAVNSYNAGKSFSGVVHSDGYLPGVFRSLEELNRVDLVDQKQTPRIHHETPGAKRTYNYYIFDGKWTPSWFDKTMYPDEYLAQSLNPSNMEIRITGQEPVPYAYLDNSNFDMSQLYQWRYNRIDTEYPANDIKLVLQEGGSGYKKDDVLSWIFGEITIEYQVDVVGSIGQIIQGHYIPKEDEVYNDDPSTYGIGIEFLNTTSYGTGAKIEIQSKARTSVHATQIKNNLYAYVDITPTVRSDNLTEWSDTKPVDTQDGLITTRSTAAGPAYSGINSGRGGPAPTTDSSVTPFYEHGGNATAGVHVHLFRYVINTEDPQWVIRDGIQVFTGEWVDQGPLGLERPCDIKALYLSNPDTNNFNNYYKFSIDTMIDNFNRSPDAVMTNNPNAVSNVYLHVDQVDPEPNQKFTSYQVNPSTSMIEEIDITNRVLYINAATGVMFMYNGSYKSDPEFNYGVAPIGWRAIAGGVTR